MQWTGISHFEIFLAYTMSLPISWNKNHFLLIDYTALHVAFIMPLYWHASRILHDHSCDNLMKKVYSQTIYRYFSQRSYLHYWSFQKEYIMLSDDTNLGLIFCKNWQSEKQLAATLDQFFYQSTTPWWKSLKDL